MTPEDEAREFIEALAAGMPRVLDGRETVLQLQQADYQWRQTYWEGFAFEFFARAVLQARCNAESGPVFGNTRLDVQREYVWDLKAHPEVAKGFALNDR